MARWQARRFRRGALPFLLRQNIAEHDSKVVENMELVKAIEALGTASGAPKKKITISASGTV